jgi:hypothetical protein
MPLRPGIEAATAGCGPRTYAICPQCKEREIPRSFYGQDFHECDICLSLLCAKEMLERGHLTQKSYDRKIARILTE